MNYFVIRFKRQVKHGIFTDTVNEQFVSTSYYFALKKFVELSQDCTVTSISWIAR